ncbi:MAG: ABC transporter substrate-binding protein [Lachnospiraceae bacterium]
MKKRKQRRTKGWLVMLALVAMMTAVLAGCAGKEKKEEKKPETKTEETKKEVRIFTDSAGREVELPSEIQTAAPSGPLAQIVLYTACPDKLAGVAADFTEDAKKYMESKYAELPKFGQFYGKNANLNMEALLKENPDVIIDIGEAKETVKEDMDHLQKQLGIPVVFVESTMQTMDQTYHMLGDLLGNPKEMATLSDYSKKTIDHATKVAKELKEEDQVSVYFALGDEGLNTNAKGSFHAEIVDLIGAKNIAEVEVTGQGAGSQVSMEQIMTWNPDVIFTYLDSVYDIITTSDTWAGLNAVKNQRVYKVPTAPYNFVSDPPSVNRMIGIDWMGSLLYPDSYEFSNEKMKAFYQGFYHIDLTDEQINEILGK